MNSSPSVYKTVVLRHGWGRVARVYAEVWRSGNGWKRLGTRDKVQDRVGLKIFSAKNLQCPHAGHILEISAGQEVQPEATKGHIMTTIAKLANEFNAQPYELAAFLDLGRDYDENAELDETTEAEYREIWSAGADC